MNNGSQEYINLIKSNIDDIERSYTQEETNIIVQQCAKDIYLFAIRYFLHYLRKPSSKFHSYLYNLIENELNDSSRKNSIKYAIAAPRGNAKCLKWNTKIQLYNGSTKNIKDITVGDTVVSINKDLKLAQDIVVAKEYSGIKNVKNIIFKSGRNITATNEHRFFNMFGEVLVKDIQIGDKLATPRKLICSNSKNTMLNEEAVFLANIIAEGCLTSYKNSCKCSYTNFDDVVVKDFKEACKKLGFGITNGKHVNGSVRLGSYNIQKALPYLRKYKLAGHSALTKLVPDEVFLQNNDFLKIFLSRFIDIDGWISKYNLQAGITLANEKLIDQLYTIFLRLGFQPTKIERPNDKAGAWAVTIYGIDQLTKLSKIGILLKQKKLLDILEKRKNITPNPNLDTIPTEWKTFLKNTTPYFIRKNNSIRVDNNYNTSRQKVLKIAKIDKNDTLLKLAISDLYWDEVISISDEYLTETYDIETKKHHNFIANNILSHNSSVISLIVPIWCIAYRKKKFIIIISDTATKAQGFLADIKRELLYNAKLAKDFPDIVGKGPMWRSSEIETNAGVKLSALGTGNNIRGERYGTHRPDLLLLDDLENSGMLRSRLERDFVRLQWFNKDVLHVKGEKGTKTDIFVVGTVLGKDSLLNALLDPGEYPDWKSKRFSAVLSYATSPLWDKWEEIYKNRFDDDRKDTAYNFFMANKDEMLEGSEVLWPEGDPYYDLMIEKLSDYSGFLSEKQNDPLDYTKILVTQDELHFENFRSDPYITKLIKSRTCPRYGAIDPSVGKRATSGDYSCVTTLLRDLKTGYLYIIDINIARRKTDYQIEAIVDSYMKHRHRLFGIETNAFQQVFADNLRTVSRVAGILIPVKDLVNSQDKKLRIEGIVPFVIDGTIVFDKYQYDNNQMYRLGVEQLTTFTGEEDRHDDFPDSLEMAVRIARKAKFKVLTKPNK